MPATGCRWKGSCREACASVLIVAVVARPVSTPCNRLLDDWLSPCRRQRQDEAALLLLMTDCTISEYFSQVLFRDWLNYTLNPGPGTKTGVIKAIARCLHDLADAPLAVLADSTDGLPGSGRRVRGYRAGARLPESEHGSRYLERVPGARLRRFPSGRW